MYSANRPSLLSLSKDVFEFKSGLCGRLNRPNSLEFQGRKWLLGLLGFLDFWFQSSQVGFWFWYWFVLKMSVELSSIKYRFPVRGKRGGEARTILITGELNPQMFQGCKGLKGVWKIWECKDIVILGKRRKH